MPIRAERNTDEFAPMAIAELVGAAKLRGLNRE
jgi:hypothetical protein